MVAAPQAPHGDLTERARACMECKDLLPHPPRPVFQARAGAPILLVGQAPGRRVHETGIPWNDPSGDRLRAWLGVDRTTFYDPACFAIVPMGLCYPGSRPGQGDLPPIPACGPRWQPEFAAYLGPWLRLRIVVGRYAIAYHLPEADRRVSEVVRNFERYFCRATFPLPHPSPRNRKWLRDRPWFENEVLPRLRAAVAGALASTHPSPSGTPGAPHHS